MSSKYLQPLRQIFRRLVSEGETFQRCASKCVISDASEGRCKMELKVEQEHTNTMGTLHGGLTSALVDIGTTCALLCTDKALPGVSVDLTVSYLSAAKPGDVVVFDSTVIKNGRTLAFTKCDVYHKDSEKMVATGE